MSRPNWMKFVNRSVPKIPRATPGTLASIAYYCFRFLLSKQNLLFFRQYGDWQYGEWDRRSDPRNLGLCCDCCLFFVCALHWTLGKDITYFDLNNFLSRTGHKNLRFLVKSNFKQYNFYLMQN